MDAKHATRRRFLKEGVALAGVAVGARPLRAQIPGSPEPERLATHAMAFGERSRFVTVTRPTMRPTMSNIGQNILRVCTANRMGSMHSRRYGTW